VSTDGPALLVVDDNDDNRYTLTRRLAREGYSNLTTATNGREALDLLQAKPFDLILLDIMMPDMNGYEVLERMKAGAELRNIPVIMISALSELDSVIRCIELGAEDYLPKPFNATLLRARVGASLEKKRLRDEVRASLARLEQEMDSARKLQLGMLPLVFPACTPEQVIGIRVTRQGKRNQGFFRIDERHDGRGNPYFWIGFERAAMMDTPEEGTDLAVLGARYVSVTPLRLDRTEFLEDHQPVTGSWDG